MIISNVQTYIAGVSVQHGYQRPSGATYSGTTPNNASYAYDDKGSTVDFTTYNTLFTTGNNTSTQIYSFYSFSMPTAGTLNVAIQYLDTQSDTNDTYSVESSVGIQVSIDGGATYLDYTNSFAGSGYYTYYYGGENWSNLTLPRSIPVGTDLANIKVKIVAKSQRAGLAANLVIAPVTVYVADVVVIY